MFKSNKNTEEVVKGFSEKVLSWGWKGLLTLVLLVTLFNSYGYNQGGVNTRVQEPIIGHTWIKDEGYYFKIPFFSKTREFNKNGTIASTDNAPLIEASGITVAPTVAQFADSYEMRFEWSMRYELPTSDEDLEFMYQKLKSQENMLANTIMPFGQTLFTDSVNQMLGGDFAQGGKNSLRTLVDNQTQYGMYQTKVERKRVSRGTGEGSNNVLGGASTDMEITKVIYLEDEAGKKLRTPLSISQYGIKIVPNSFQIVENDPVGRLVQYIETKQNNQRLQIEQDEKQKILAKQAQTSQLEGEKRLVERTNELNIKKQEAIIAMQQQVEQAKLQAEKETVEREKVAALAVIDKNRELQIAESNEGIQKANYNAAKYEAQATLELGLAEAKVAKEKLAAKQSNKEIYLAELALEEAKAIAKVLPHVNITSPQVVMSGSGSNGNAVSDLLSTKLVQDVVKGSK